MIPNKLVLSKWLLRYVVMDKKWGYRRCIYSATKWTWSLRCKFLDLIYSENTPTAALFVPLMKLGVNPGKYLEENDARACLYTGLR